MCFPTFLSASAAECEKPQQELPSQLGTGPMETLLRQPPPPGPSPLFPFLPTNPFAPSQHMLALSLSTAMVNINQVYRSRCHQRPGICSSHLAWSLSLTSICLLGVPPLGLITGRLSLLLTLRTAQILEHLVRFSYGLCQFSC